MGGKVGELVFIQKVASLRLSVTAKEKYIFLSLGNLPQELTRKRFCYVKHAERPEIVQLDATLLPPQCVHKHCGCNQPRNPKKAVLNAVHQRILNIGLGKAHDDAAYSQHKGH